MQPDQTVIMLDQLLRVVLSEAIRAVIWAIVFYPVIKLAAKSL